MRCKKIKSDISTRFRLQVSCLLCLACFATVCAQQPELIVQTGHAENVGTVAFSPDGKVLASASSDGAIKLWNVSTGLELRTLAAQAANVSCLAFSPDGKVLAARIGFQVKLFDAMTGAEIRALKGHLRSVNSIAFSADGRLIVSGSGDVYYGKGESTIKLWDVSTGALRLTLPGHAKPVRLVAFSPDAKLIASGGDDEKIKLWDSGSGRELRPLEGDYGSILSLAFTSDGSRLISSGSERATIFWDTNTGRQLQIIRGHPDLVTADAQSPDGKILASASHNRTIHLWEITTGNLLQNLSGHRGMVYALAFSPDGKWLASAGSDATIRLWEVETGRELLSLLALDEQDWLVAAPDGLFDGSAAAWNQILWRFSQNLFDVSPVEIFFNEFYHPGLLADVFTGRGPRAHRDISQKDRRQPQVAITLAEGHTTSDESISSRNVRVKIKVSESPANKEHARSSGAQDLRLFRNGLLVKVWRGNLFDKHAADECRSVEPGSIVCEASLPLIAGKNALVAYAFNQDNIKSADASLSLTGAESLRRRGVAYILTVGVNSYANAEYNLKYAVADATEFGEEFKRQQEKLGQYQRVEILSLSDKDAAKSKIIESINGLAAKVQPEDAVIFYFAGHGTAAKDRFYLIPHDLGYTGPRRQLDQTALDAILAHSISDRELERAFEGLDAGQILFVIDACNSGQALEAEEKRRGPMNSKGLAQLAYEKGMYILTAAQSYQAAMEASRLGHGYLTYALVEEGLKKGAADHEPQDKQIVLREWLNYASRRVPEMQLETMNAAAQQTRILEQEEITFVEGEEKIRDPKRRSMQRPRAFFRREPEAQPFIVAKP